ncbi:phytanoyl-CoA dioxygenase family protein [Psychrosphaera algicola]|uniref:Phytanoyl-CoA dioxygenase family protein n=1 Tax=Psychrosphaera algicola TaxID=3023714 RepID=A0ABT5FJJ2_9GAMM|nr:phytanoyl-CoA dioxygenase family protein [Psychrosphaera sp. G1-22]MDC2891351.1 phytanoyl-CoA dioxygenase family protein [Psychrosphaera sp. G1-22]
MFTEHLAASLKEFADIADLSMFTIDTYHKFLNENNISHHDFIKFVGRKLPDEFLSHPYVKIVCEIAGKETGFNFGVYKNKIEFRVVRPNCGDNNPFHRDHWFPYFTPLLNVYVPLCGSYYDSSLCVVPFSHKWSDEDVVPTFTFEESAKGKKYIKNGVAYSVPDIKECKFEIKPHRPDVLLGDVMYFSPLMVHGGGSNSSLETRFSLEMRLVRV